MFLRILWMHDLSPRSEAALELIRWLAPRSDAEILVAHALGAPLAPGMEAQDPLLETRRRDAEAVLLPLRDRLAAEGLVISLRIEPGQPLELASRLVEQERVGLCVVGATGTSGLDRLLLGSSTEKLVRALPCSVLVARAPFHRPQRVLCALDLHQPAFPAILEASALARIAGAQLEFLTVVDPAVHVREVEEPEQALARAVKDALGGEHDARFVFAKVVAETPAQGILHRAGAADLVVMGTHGRRGLERLLLGSVAESVVRSCPVSVLVTR